MAPVLVFKAKSAFMMVKGMFEKKKKKKDNNEIP